jgi:predicted nucleic acid-binding Zn ribbon protein
LFKVQGSRFKVPVTELVEVPGSGFHIPDSRFKVQGSKFKVQGSRFKVPVTELVEVPGSGFHIPDSRFKVQGSKFKVQSSKFKVQSLRLYQKSAKISQICVIRRGAHVSVPFVNRKS